MGSTGSGSFTDYSGFNSNGTSNQGGKSGEDKCGKAFSSLLEEVPNCDYYSNNSTLPPVGTSVVVVFANLRLEIRDSNNNVIGYLPTKYNYLRACMQEGLSYGGLISNSSLHPLPNLTVDIAPV